MDLIVRHKIQHTEHGEELILYIDPQLMEFSNELGEKDLPKVSLDYRIRKYIKEKVPNLHAKTVKLMMGTILLATLSFDGDKTYAAESPKDSNDSKIVAQRNDINILINGKYHSYSQPPIIIEGRTFIPLRGVSETLGAYVWWENKTRTVGIEKDNVRVTFTIGSKFAEVNGKKIEMDPSVLRNNTTMVPIRFISETLGMKVGWDQNTRTVLISNPHEIYTVNEGDTLWAVANKFETTVEAIKGENRLETETIYVGQKLTIPNGNTNSVSNTEGELIVHRVNPGETLSHLAEQYKVSVNEIKKWNQLTSDSLYVGQTLIVSGDESITSNLQENNTSYITHEIQSGDNMWNLSVKYGLPMNELLAANRMTTESRLSLGQKITVPVHEIAVKPTVSAKHGEFLDWWSEAQYIFTINSVAKVTDFATGETFMVKRTIGANHADCEPLTAVDAEKMKKVWGGSYSWATRAVLVEVDGRKIAGSMTSMPHDVQYITDNNFNGHFDIHFKNSTRHKDGRIDHSHQEKIRTAAGITEG